jgi:cell division septation protein DedD
VRIAFYVLLAVNLVYLAWAGWIDAPRPPAVAAKTRPALPELKLATEATSSDQTRLASATAPAGQPVATLASSDEPAGASNTRCVSIGPFSDLTHAARGAALLRDRGFNPKQRAEPGEMWEGFWVYVGGLKSAADEAKVVKTLERAGLNDAHAMPDSDEGRRVSVGLFTEKDRAEKRAAAVKRLGYAAEIVERKQPAPVYWVDLALSANDRTVPTEGLLSDDDAGARLEIRVCPSSSPAPAAPKPGPLPRDARPAATTADAGVPRPG